MLPLSKRDLVIAGLFFYWGEGNKRIDGSISINNTDPSVIKFALYWYTHVLKIPKEKIKVYLHLYNDMNILNEINYWSNELNIPISQFSKPYIKKSSRMQIDQKGFGHGTCAIIMNDVRLKEKIIMGIQTIADFYGKKIDVII